ncbi:MULTISPECIES: hypothetical protein [unclassified Mesorhizobium]|uniref:hypothetical protein n=1 Tax=unclassified Mesorhizobium TaxID=325217 RepID=UPI001128D0C2|nr:MULTISPECIES: hypothetical protein [unclassified Mesorhizobium]MBZ9954312.1 hypothetical protein [Mesorhizobium sp. BR1-1-15]TPJ61262.1 hypothetical protein FJ443_18265 [Mesorhizobium sp. B2-6-1]
MTRRKLSTVEAQTFLRHARQAAALTTEQEETISGLVEDAINQYQENWRSAVNEECSRLERILDGLCAALAPIIAEGWKFADGLPAPFHDEASAYRWLKAEGEQPAWVGGDVFPAPERDEHFALYGGDWMTTGLWERYKKIHSQLSDLHAYGDFRSKDHWAKPPAPGSRMPLIVQELIHGLCQVWHDHTDARLGLPRRDPDPENPLLRFVDACLAIAIGDDRPGKATLLDFIARRSRPEILEKG